MDIMNIWRIIYNDIDDKNPNATGDEILAMTKDAFNEVMKEVISEDRKEVK